MKRTESEARTSTNEELSKCTLQADKPERYQNIMNETCL